MGRPFLSRAIAALAGAAFVALLAGCGSLLPRGTSDTPAGFATFEEAEAAARRVEGLKTRTEDLRALGFDVAGGSNVTLIPYPDIVARLAPHPGVAVDQLDPGIRECIHAQSACRGYLFHFERQDRKRQGSFWLDFLNLRRHTFIKGWWFDALFVVSDGLVLFRNYGGQASTDRVEKQVNPLGPFQPAGESAGWQLVH
jgi:hypothetical protein